MLSYSQILVPEFEQEMESTRKLLACLPDDRLTWKPHDKSFSLARLAGHVAEMPLWGRRVMEHDSYNFGSSDSQPYTPYFAGSSHEAVSRLNDAAGEARSVIANAPNERFEQTWSFLYKGRPVFSAPRIQVLRSMFLNHLVHHRGQLSVYLRLLNVPIPGMYGPSADVPAEVLTASK